MTKGLYLRLAGRNLRASRQTTLPFLIASSLLFFSALALMMLSDDPGVMRMESGQSVQMLLGFGVVVVCLFQGIILFYANSFLIRRRQHEFGLYGVLGLGKHHVARVLIYEMAGLYLLTVMLGALLALVLGQGVFWLMQKMLGMSVPISGSLTSAVFLRGAVVLGVWFLALTGYNVASLRMANPIQLLKSRETGEREPKANWLWALVSLLLLGGGYGIALFPPSGSAALGNFFLAVLLVVLGTFMLFQSGVVAVLHLLKGLRSVYYRPGCFVSISGLMHRVKQHAAGLASICILCTMTMVTMGGSLAMYLGREASLGSLYPAEFIVRAESESELKLALQAVDQADAAFHISPERQQLHYWEIFGTLEKDTLVPFQGSQSQGWISGKIFLKSEYERLQGTSISLNPGEIGWTGDPGPGALTFHGISYPAVPVPAPSFTLPEEAVVNTRRVLLVVDTPELAREMSEAMMFRQPEGVISVQWNTGLKDDERAAYYQTLIGLLKNTPLERSLHSRDGERQAWMSINGGFLLIGVFLSFVFMLGTALMMYFKQISEGYQDYHRFIILQKVGMSHEEVRRTISHQTLILFFLPLVVALIHVAGAMPTITVILMQMGISTLAYTFWMTLGSALLVGLVYGLFYRLTAGAYLKLVRF